jgi:hypothetical protein
MPKGRGRESGKGWGWGRGRRSAPPLPVGAAGHQPAATSCRPRGVGGGGGPRMRPIWPPAGTRPLAAPSGAAGSSRAPAGTASLCAALSCAGLARGSRVSSTARSGSRCAAGWALAMSARRAGRVHAARTRARAAAPGAIAARPGPRETDRGVCKRGRNCRPAGRWSAPGDCRVRRSGARLAGPQGPRVRPERRRTMRSSLQQHDSAAWAHLAAAPTPLSRRTSSRRRPGGLRRAGGGGAKWSLGSASRRGGGRRLASRRLKSARCARCRAPRPP